MKKTLIALAAIAATSAFAQSSVSLYGRADVGYANQSVSTTRAGVDTKNTFNGVTSHNSVSSYWGIMGTEDLGGGLKANFKFEQDLFPATGATGGSGADSGVTASTTNGAVSDRAATGAFNRISLVGLSGGFGSVNLGTDYLPTFKLAAATDVFGQSYLTTVGLSAGTHGVGLGTITQGNIGNISATGTTVGTGAARQIQYSTPNFNGFTGNLAYVNVDGSVSGGTVVDTTNKHTNVSAIYSNGPLYVGLAYGVREFQSATAVKSKNELTVFGASYDFKTFKVVGNWLSSKSTASDVSTDTTSTEYNLGVTVPFGAVTAIAQIGRNTYSSNVTGQNGDASGNDWAIGADYALSKRTTAFVKTGTTNKLEGTIAGQIRDTKRDVTSIGVRHTF